MLAWAEDGAKRLLDLEDTDGQITELEARRDRIRAELGTLAAKLTKQRVAAAKKLGKAVSHELTSLAMPHATVSIAVTQAELPVPTTPAGPQLLVDGRWLRGTAHGVDEVELLLAANTGADPRPLHKGASGGELSRVMLALEVSLAETGSVPTFVFDEVDAGVGGRAAIEIGRRLAALARSSQVLVVTHLPQVAAYADRHVVVHKSSDGSVTTSAWSPSTRPSASASCRGCWPGSRTPTAPGPTPASSSTPPRPSGRASRKGRPAADTMARS